MAWYRYAVVRYDGNKNLSLVWDACTREQFRLSLALMKAMKEGASEVLMSGSFDPRYFRELYPLLKAAVEEAPAHGTFDVDGLRARITAAERELNGKK